jgi:hypothetical protein
LSEEDDEEWRRRVFERAPMELPAEEHGPLPWLPRALGVAGLLLLVYAQLSAWGWYIEPYGAQGQLVDSQMTDGFIAMLLAFVVLMALIAPLRIGRLGYLPLGLGVICLLPAVTAVQGAYIELRDVQSRGMRADLNHAVWVALAGGICSAVAGLTAAEPLRAVTGLLRLHGDRRSR